MAHWTHQIREDGKQFVDPSSRYAKSRVLYYTENKYVTFETYKRMPQNRNPEDQWLQITKQIEYRPDIVAGEVYGSPNFWWKLLEFNGMKDILEFKAGKSIQIPGKYIMSILVEPGRCDPSLCNSVNVSDNPFIKCNDIDCVFGGSSCLTSPATVPIKQLLKGSLAAPWVRLRFEGANCPPASIVPDCVLDGNKEAVPANWDYTEITTGNISQPGAMDGYRCRAVIKSFQYAWGGTASGNIAKLTIEDETGSTFDDWFKRVVRNPLGAARSDPNDGMGVYKMKVTFGWVVVGGDTDCPASVDWTCPSQITQTAIDNCCTANAPYSNNPNRIICSPPMWFLPTNLHCTIQGNRFIYELEGNDLLMQAWQQPMSNTFGATNNPTHFVDAVVKLGQKSRPPFNVQFVQLNESGQNNTLENLEFNTPNNVGVVGHTHYVDAVIGANNLNYFKDCTASPQQPDGFCQQSGIDAKAFTVDLAARGPLNRYSCNQMDPVACIQHWTTLGVRAKTTQRTGGKGITINYDSTYVVPENEQQLGLPNRGRLLVWADPGVGGIMQNQNFPGLTQALYIINGGNCSPVYSFSPNIKWHFNAMRAGGTSGPANGTQHAARENEQTGLLQFLGLSGNTGPGPVRGTSDNGMKNALGPDADHEYLRSLGDGLRTNSLHNVIEAELRVQGDPSLWLCSPAFGTGRTIALVVIKPFTLSDPLTGDACPDWDHPSGVCHKLLTSNNWFIDRVEHQIKEGSYITTIKVKLFAPNVDMPGASASDSTNIPIMNFGADPGRDDSFICQAGTTTCDGRNTGDAESDVTSGADKFCEPLCSNSNIIIP